MSTAFDEMMAGAVAKTRPGNAEGGMRKAEGKKATIRIELPHLLAPPPPPQPSAWEAMCLAADTMLAVISTYHNLVVAGTLKPTEAERLRVTIAMEQLSTCSHQVIRMLEKGGAS